MRIGMVCPYSLDTPGGVQNHVKDLAEAMVGRGHDVSVLAPSEREAGLPAYVVPAGRAVSVPYNGSVARLAFGPTAVARTRRWLREGRFDVVHLHEPSSPSLSMIALMQAEVPVVATFHTSQPRSRAMSASSAILRPWMEKLTARIAVSEDARDTLVHHVGGEPVVIPNGIYVDRFADAPVRPEWQTSAGPTITFVGRVGEPRKGLPVLLDALPALRRRFPGLQLLVVGSGDVHEAARQVDPELREAIRFLGPVDDEAKAGALRAADLYVAPNTGGESFGIILIEAMAVGTAVLASDLGAFRRVLADGELGALFATGDAEALASAATVLLDDPDRRCALVAAASGAVRRYDWATIAVDILSVYETVVGR